MALYVIFQSHISLSSRAFPFLLKSSLDQNCKMNTRAACYASSWTKEENKAFENAIAIYGDADKWENITAAVPGKTVEDAKHHYRALVNDVIAIEVGLVPLPNYASSSHNSSYLAGGVSIKTGSNRTAQARSDSTKEKRSERIVERKRGKAWTKEEHRNFLEGLEKYGKGDWRSISRHCVVSRTPTQVASHAQKYYKRLQSPNWGRKSSIHDVTSVDSATTSTGQRPITRERSEASQMEKMDDASASKRPISAGQSGAGDSAVSRNRASQQVPVSAQTTGLAGVDFTGGTSIQEMPSTTETCEGVAVRSIAYFDENEFTNKRVSQQLPVSAQMIGLAGEDFVKGTSIMQMPLAAQTTKVVATLAPVDYTDIEFTSGKAYQQLPIPAQTVGTAGCIYTRRMALSAEPTGAAVVVETRHTEGIEFTCDAQSQQLPVFPQTIELTGVDFAGGSSLLQTPLKARPTEMAAVGPSDYPDGIEFNANRVSQQLPISAQMVGFAGVDLIQCTSIPQMPAQRTGMADEGPNHYPGGNGFSTNRATQQLPAHYGFVGSGFAEGTSIPQMHSIVQPTGAATVCSIDYMESLIPSSIAGVSMGFHATPSLPVQRPFTSTDGMPEEIPHTTSTMHGVTQTPYELFVPHPPVNFSPTTYQMQPPSDQNL